jgi:hypothetical protein
MRASVH